MSDEQTKTEPKLAEQQHRKHDNPTPRMASIAAEQPTSAPASSSANATADEDSNAKGSSEPSHEAVLALKQEGNTAFVAGKFRKAERLYSEAISTAQAVAAADPDYNVDAKLYGNRSAAKHNLEKYEDALTDAIHALEIDPKWVKGYHRKAIALLSLNKFQAGVAAYEEALKLDPENVGLKQKLKRAQKRAQDHVKRSRVRGLSHWLSIFGSQQDMRLRLGVMATFWNKASQAERLLIFRQFLSIIVGASADEAQLKALQDEFSISRMTELPLGNYSDLEIPEHWISYFEDLTAELKVSYFEQMFKSLSEQEKTLVINDLKYFFQAPV